MNIAIVCHVPRGSRSGNRRTAERWARMFRELGHRVTIAAEAGPADVVIALHARHSAKAIARAPGRPIILALTGTDLYDDIHHDAAAKRSLALADRIVVLHDLAPADVPRRYRGKVVVIRQSAEPVTAPKPRGFRVAVVGHLRDVKDPLLTAKAARLLPARSRIEVVHAGAALDDASERAATAEAKANPRYRWRGEFAPRRAQRLIASAHLLALTSKSEGGANVLGEAIVCGTPIVATDIPASRAALGSRYPGLFPVGDVRRLARLLERFEVDRAFRDRLSRAIRARRPRFGRRVEIAAWRRLLTSIPGKARR